jgi:hypothetical protein
MLSRPAAWTSGWTSAVLCFSAAGYWLAGEQRRALSGRVTASGLIRLLRAIGDSAFIDLTIVRLIHFPKLEDTLSVVVILLMFFAVIVMVMNVDNDLEERATLAPHSSETQDR